MVLARKKHPHMSRAAIAFPCTCNFAFESPSPATAHLVLGIGSGRPNLMALDGPGVQMALAVPAVPAHTEPITLNEALNTIEELTNEKKQLLRDLVKKEIDKDSAMQEVSRLEKEVARLTRHLQWIQQRPELGEVNVLVPESPDGGRAYGAEVFTVPVSKEETLNEVRQKIAAKTGIDPEHQRVIMLAKNHCPKEITQWGDVKLKLTYLGHGDILVIYKEPITGWATDYLDEIPVDSEKADKDWGWVKRADSAETLALGDCPRSRSRSRSPHGVAGGAAGSSDAA